MPITEIVFTNLKDDPSLVKQRGKVISEAFQWFPTVPGTLSWQAGIILREDGDDVAEEGNLCLALEWESTEPFFEVVKSLDFQKFKEKLAPYVEEFAKPDLFEDRAQHVLKKPVTQLLMVKHSDDIGSTDEEWTAIKRRIQATTKNVEFYSGTGVGISDQDTFLGAIGWESLKACEETTNSPSVKEALDDFLATGEGTNHIVQLKPIPKA